MAVSLRFELNHTITIANEYGHEAKYYVRDIQRDGWRLEPYDQPGNLEYFSDDTILEAYLSLRLRYLPYDPAALSAERLAKREAAFESNSAKGQRRARRHGVFVRAVEEKMRAGVRKGQAIAEAISEVFEANSKGWHEEDQRDLDDEFQRRVDKGLADPSSGDKPARAKPFKKPTGRTVWTWVRDYTAAGRSLSGLVQGAIGYHGSHLHPEAEARAMDFITTHVVKMPIYRPGAAYARYRRTEEDAGRRPIGRVAFINRVNAELTQRRIIALKEGKQIARRAGRVSRATPKPFFVNHESEIDHALFNVNLLDDDTGELLGSPWVTADRERSTGAVRGVHMSFLSPQWATQARCLAHACWPKDLTEQPQIKSAWSVMGLVERSVTDRGADFIGKSNHKAGHDLQFDITNLPSHSPWLKGGVEGWNRTAKWNVQTYADGIKAFESPDYDSRNFASMTVNEFKSGFLTWLVDDYMGKPATGIPISRNQRWLDEIALEGPPRPADPDLLRRALCIPRRRSIQSYGVRVGGHEFNAPELEAIACEYPGFSFLVLIDPFDLMSIELLNPKGIWVVCFNKNPEAGNGVTLYQNEVHHSLAVDRKPSADITYDDLIRSKEIAEDDLERLRKLKRKKKGRLVDTTLGRYQDRGEFMTPVRLRPLAPRIEVPEIVGYRNENGIYRPNNAPIIVNTAVVVAPISTEVGAAPLSPPPAAPQSGSTRSKKNTAVSFKDLDDALEKRISGLGK